MNRNQMIENIRIACHCGERRAGEYLDAELCSLRELQLRNELRLTIYVEKFYQET